MGFLSFVIKWCVSLDNWIWLNVIPEEILSHMAAETSELTVKFDVNYCSVFFTKPDCGMLNHLKVNGHHSLWWNVVWHVTTGRFGSCYCIFTWVVRDQRQDLSLQSDYLIATPHVASSSCFCHDTETKFCPSHRATNLIQFICRQLVIPFFDVTNYTHTVTIFGRSWSLVILRFFMVLLISTDKCQDGLS
jgi:hypothetical protein